MLSHHAVKIYVLVMQKKESVGWHLPEEGRAALCREVTQGPWGQTAGEKARQRLSLHDSTNAIKR